MVLEGFGDVIFILRNNQTLKSQNSALNISYQLKSIPTNNFFPESFFHNIETEHRLHGSERAADALCDGLEILKNNDAIVWLLVAADILQILDIVNCIKLQLNVLQANGNADECCRLNDLYRSKFELIKSTRNACRKRQLNQQQSEFESRRKIEKFGDFYSQHGYTHREELEDQIRLKVMELFSSASSTLMISGQGGVGKSWIVRESLTSSTGLQYLESHGVAIVAWLNVFKLSWQVERFDSEAFINELVRLFDVKCGNVCNNNRFDLIKHIRQLRSKVLLILDDVFDAEVIENVQGIDPDNMRIICISRLNYANHFLGRGFLEMQAIEIKPLTDDGMIKLIYEKLLVNKSKWNVSNDVMLQEVAEKVSKVCYGLALLARIFTATICSKRKWQYVLSYVDKLQKACINVLKENVKNEGKETSVCQMLLDDFENRGELFQQRFLVFLMFEEGTLVTIDELAILWQTADAEMAEDIASELHDASFVRCNEEMTSFEIHSLLYHAAVFFACQPVRDKQNSVLFEGMPTLSIEIENDIKYYDQVRKAVNRLRKNFISTLRTDSKTGENVFHRAVSGKVERVIEIIDSTLIDELGEKLFDIFSQQTCKTKETPLHMLMKCTDWPRGDENHLNRFYCLEKACYLSDRLLRYSERLDDSKRAVDLLTKRLDDSGNSLLQLMWRTVSNDNVERRELRWQQNALLVAAGNCNGALYKLMLESMGVDNINNITDRNGNNALMVAADNWKVTIIAATLKSRSYGRPIVDVNAKNERGRTALMISSEWGDDLSVTSLFEDSREAVGVNLEDNDGFTALMYAAKANLTCTEILLKHGSDVNLKSHRGYSALWLAVANGETSIAELLHDNYDAKLNAEEITVLLQLCSYRNFTETHQMLLQWKKETASTDSSLTTSNMTQAICRACNLENTNFAADVMSSDFAAIRHMPTEKREKVDAMLLASYIGDCTFAQLLLADDKELAWGQNDAGWSALMMAAANGHGAFVDLLGRCDDLLDFCELTDNDFKRTALIWAAFYGHDKIVEKLITVFKCNVDARDKCHNNALRWACRNGHLNAIKTLINLGKADVNSVNMDSVTPLMSAIKTGRVDVIKYLLSTCKIRPNAKNVDGHTATMYAAERGDVTIGQMLLQIPATDPNAAAYDGETPLIKACWLGHENFVDLLLTIDIVRQNINAARLDGVTALSWASRKNHINIARKLIENGADVNVKENDGSTPFMHASKQGFQQIVEMLLHTGKVAN